MSRNDGIMQRKLSKGQQLSLTGQCLADFQRCGPQCVQVPGEMPQGVFFKGTC